MYVKNLATYARRVADEKPGVVTQKNLVGHFEVREPAENKRKLLGQKRNLRQTLPLFSSNVDLTCRSRIQKYEQENEQELEACS
jgi:hypothetical protein